MALFLVFRPCHSPLVRGLLRVLSPILTGPGFAVGAAFFTHFRRLAHLPFRRLYLYPLAGCSFGAVVVLAPNASTVIVIGNPQNTFREGICRISHCWPIHEAVLVALGFALVVDFSCGRACVRSGLSCAPVLRH